MEFRLKSMPLYDLSVTEPDPMFLLKTLTLPPTRRVQLSPSVYSTDPSTPTVGPSGVGRMPTPMVPLILRGGGATHSPNSTLVRKTFGAMGTPFPLKPTVAPRFAT